MHERPVTIGVALSRFLEDRTLEGRSRGTLKTYRSALRSFRGDERPITAITPALCRSMIAEKMSGSRSTARTLAAILKSFGAWLSATYGVANPMAGVPKPREIRPPHRYLSPAQVRDVWAACPDDSYRLLVGLLLHGLRASEAVGLRWRDVSGDVAQVLGKGSRYRKVALSASVVALLDAAPRDGEHVLGYTYNTAWWRIKRLGRLAGVPLNPHLFRHSFASNGLLLGMDTETLRQAAGWSPGSKAMERYIESAREQAALTRSREFGLVDRLLEGE